LRLGSFKVNVISDGCFWLDGGAMFGVVPKALWEKKTLPDGNNRIQLGLNCLLVQTETDNILIDTGCGRKYSEKEFRIYGIDRAERLLEALRQHGLTASDITIIATPHLHFDQ